MRAGVVGVLIAVTLALAPSASAGVFPDLPGLKGVERLTHASVPAESKGGAKAQDVKQAERIPAPDAKVATTGPVSATDKAFIRNLPGGAGLPVFGKDAKAASSSRGTVLALVLLALLTVVLFTRFLVRLNSLGRSAA